MCSSDLYIKWGFRWSATNALSGDDQTNQARRFMGLNLLTPHVMNIVNIHVTLVGTLCNARES